MAAPPARVPKEPTLRKKFTQTARRIGNRFTTFSCVGRMGVVCYENDISRASPLGLRRLLVRDWLLEPPCSAVLRARSSGSGLLLFLMVDERLEKVSICGRQRLRPHGHRLHMPLERFSFLKGVLYGVVERCLGHGGPIALLLVEAPRRSMFFSTTC